MRFSSLLAPSTLTSGTFVCCRHAVSGVSSEESPRGACRLEGKWCKWVVKWFAQLTQSYAVSVLFSLPSIRTNFSSEVFVSVSSHLPFSLLPFTAIKVKTVFKETSSVEHLIPLGKSIACSIGFFTKMLDIDWPTPGLAFLPVRLLQPILHHCQPLPWSRSSHGACV